VIVFTTTVIKYREIRH